MKEIQVKKTSIITSTKKYIKLDILRFHSNCCYLRGSNSRISNCGAVWSQMRWTLKLSDYRNYYIDRNQILYDDNDHRVLFVGGPNTSQTKWRKYRENSAMILPNMMEFGTIMYITSSEPTGCKLGNNTPRPVDRHTSVNSRPTIVACWSLSVQFCVPHDRRAYPRIVWTAVESRGRRGKREKSRWRCIWAVQTDSCSH